MEPNYGIISVIPAIVVIGLALYTKKTVLSLVIGTFLGELGMNLLAVLLANALAPLIDYCVVNANINRRLKRASVKN